MFRAREISHTDWVQYCIALVYLKPEDLNLSQDLTHHNWPTPDIASSFSVCCVGVMGIWCLRMVLLIYTQPQYDSCNQHCVFWKGKQIYTNKIYIISDSEPKHGKNHNQMTL